MRSKQCARKTKPSKRKLCQRENASASPVVKKLKEGVLTIEVKNKNEKTDVLKKKEKNDVLKKKETTHVFKKKIDKEKNATQSNFTCQSRPNGLAQLIKVLSEKQKEDVRSIGFGGLLSLKLTLCSNHRMLKWLVDNFNCSSHMLTIDNHRSFAITADDVFDVFMLPRNDGTPVLEYAWHDKDPLPPLLSRLKADYEIKAGAGISCLTKALNDKLGDGGDDFKRIFVYYALSSFLVPTSNKFLVTKYLKSVEDVGMIPKLDWCSLVFNKLCEAITSYKQKGLKNITGCILILQIVYFHKLKWRGFVESSKLPLIQHWDDEKIGTRCSQEAAAGKYGSGELNLYTLSVNGKIVENDGGKRDEAEKIVNEETVPKEPVVEEEVGADGTLEKEVMELLASFKKDANQLFEKYHSKAMKINAEKQSMKDKQAPPELSDSQFFKDESVLSSIDKLIDYMVLTRKLAAEMPSFELLSPEPVNLAEYGLDGIDLELEDVNLAENCDGEQVDEPVPEEELADAMNSVGHKTKNTGEVPSNEFWSIIEDVGYVSKTISSNKKLFQDMLQTHKEIVDYCLCEYEGVDYIDEFFRNGKTNVVAKDGMLTMIPNTWICLSVITAWISIVNKDCSVNDNRSRFIFNMEHSAPLTKLISGNCDVEANLAQIHANWKVWIEFSGDTLSTADLIFIPFWLQNHFAAVVINLVDKKTQYLDNRKYDETNDFFDCAKILISQMSTFLESRKHPKAKDVSTFEFENVQFKWQTKKLDYDCGVYLMHHLKHFNGSIYTYPDMTKALIRRVLRAEICATIVLSDMNEVKDDVLSKVYDFYNNKTALIQRIADEKKDETLRAAQEKKKIVFERRKKKTNN